MNTTNNIMGKITISLSNETEQKLRKLSKENFRSISKELEYLVIKEYQEKHTKK